METDIDLLRRLGGLRDATVEEVVWRKADRSLRLTIADMYGNLDGRAGYPGPSSGAVTFLGLDGLTIETALFRGVFRISGIEVERRGDQLVVRVGLGEPGSDLRIVCKEIRVTIGDR